MFGLQDPSPHPQDHRGGGQMLHGTDSIDPRATKSGLHLGGRRSPNEVLDLSDFDHPTSGSTREQSHPVGPPGVEPSSRKWRSRPPVGKRHVKEGIFRVHLPVFLYPNLKSLFWIITRCMTPFTVCSLKLMTRAM